MWSRSIVRGGVGHLGSLVSLLRVLISLVDLGNQAYLSKRTDLVVFSQADEPKANGFHASVTKEGDGIVRVLEVGV